LTELEEANEKNKNLCADLKRLEAMVEDLDQLRKRPTDGKAPLRTSGIPKPALKRGNSKQQAREGKEGSVNVAPIEGI
jgi:hypothetical protein